MANLSVGDMIVQQLGGHRFIAMTNASGFIVGGRRLSFLLPGTTGQRRRIVRVTLTPDDDYDLQIETYGRPSRVLGQAEGIQAENLPETFTRLTGLAVRL
jgi:hypothetical protein